MRTILIASVLLLASQSFGKNDYSVSFELKDLYTQKLLSTYTLEVRTTSGELLIDTSVVNDSNFRLSGIDEKKVVLIVTDPSGHYIRRKTTLINKKGTIPLVYFDMYPAWKYEPKIALKEDSIYGSHADLIAFWEPKIKGMDTLNVIDAEFPGGIPKMQRFVVNQVSYPEECLDNGARGRVYLNFIIEADGTVSHITVDKGVNDLLDAEATRVVRAMPRWSPASIDGTPVRSLARLPIVFTLN